MSPGSTTLSVRLDLLSGKDFRDHTIYGQGIMPKLGVPLTHQNGTWGCKRIRANFFVTIRKVEYGDLSGGPV